MTTYVYMEGTAYEEYEKDPEARRKSWDYHLWCEAQHFRDIVHIFGQSPLHSAKEPPREPC